MKLYETMDPFVMQLVIIPLVVIGVGVWTAIYFRRFLLGPFVTLILNLVYEILYSHYYYPNLKIILSSYNYIYPICSFLISWISITLLSRKYIENKDFFKT